MTEVTLGPGALSVLGFGLQKQVPAFAMPMSPRGPPKGTDTKGTPC